MSRVVKLSLVLWSVFAFGCRPDFRANRDGDRLDTEHQEWLDSLSPDAYVDRWGDPDEWSEEGEGDNLRLTTVWKCLDGERRELVWRRTLSSTTGREFWNLIEDDVSDGDCPGE